jgi:alpha-tubulin suppressor-like RCC1 family protein
LQGRSFSDEVQLGDGTRKDSWWPVRPKQLLVSLRLGLGEAHVCAHTRSWHVLCWGAGQAGQLGDGTTNDAIGPTMNRPVLARVRTFAVGSSHNCAATRLGELLCWGANGSGQAGVSVPGHAIVPVPTKVPFDRPVAAVAAGTEHTCVIKAGTSQVYCWGSNRYGQLGAPTAGPILQSSVPLQVMLPH